MDKALSFVQRRLFWLIIFSIVLGLIFTALTGGYAFTPAVCLLAALIMIYPSLVPLEFDRIRGVGQQKRRLALTLVINFLVAPLLAAGLGYIFLQQEPGLWLGLILVSVLPGGGMVTTWAFKSKADMPLTVSIVLVNLLAAIILAPLYLTVAMNQLNLLVSPASGQVCTAELVTNGAIDCLFSGAGGVSPLKITVPIVVIIIIPLVLAYLTQTRLKKAFGLQTFDKIKQQFAAASNLGMLVVLFVLMGIKNNSVIFEHPEYVLKAIPSLLLFYIINLIISWQINKRVGGAEGRAMFWGTYLRYVTLALGLAISLLYQNPAYNLSVIMVVLAYLVQIPSSFWLAKKLS